MAGQFVFFASLVVSVLVLCSDSAEFYSKLDLCLRGLHQFFVLFAKSEVREWCRVFYSKLHPCLHDLRQFCSIPSPKQTNDLNTFISGVFVGRRYLREWSVKFLIRECTVLFHARPLHPCSSLVLWLECEVNGPTVSGAFASFRYSARFMIRRYRVLFQTPFRHQKSLTIRIPLFPVLLYDKRTIIIYSLCISLDLFKIKKTPVAPQKLYYHLTNPSLPNSTGLSGYSCEIHSNLEATCLKVNDIEHIRPDKNTRLFFFPKNAIFHCTCARSNSGRYVIVCPLFFCNITSHSAYFMYSMRSVVSFCSIFSFKYNRMSSSCPLHLLMNAFLKKYK